MKIALCGAGNAAQLLIALLGRMHEVTVFAPLGDEAERLRAACATAGVSARFSDSVQSGRPARITADPQTAVQRAELVLLATPAFAHEPVLATLAPYLAEGVQIAALPARGGFDWMAQRSVALPPRTTLIGLQSFPWACRIRTWGRTVEALGVKAEVDAAVWPEGKTEEALAQLETLLGVRLRPCSNFLALTLANTGQVIHPGIMYGLFHKWDGASFACKEAPLFYGGVDDVTAGILQALSDEV
ncbi:MAG: NAD(P)-binding domain-containing protein, partial [Caldilinea sp.]|nr:NAD(P)-binding domain-containing protein [Caldilinea sp.]MDW8440936.1 NAD(P)-binding domain-containing protein [Caldilineaceae bacterium]